MPPLPDPPRMMGVLNLTPDSFSDGGRFTGVEAAVAHGLDMARQGASIIDIGGESTRPGAQRITVAEQCDRVLPVIRALRQALDAQHPHVAISIDTTRAAVARAALDAGAAMLNDIAAAREDPAMLELAAQRGVPIVLMHMQGEPATMQQQPHYEDVVAEVKAFLLERADAAMAAGVPRHRIIIDPGIGFGKTVEHNLQLLAHLETFVATGFTVLLGASRKSFLAPGSGPSFSREAPRVIERDRHITPGSGPSFSREAQRSAASPEVAPAPGSPGTPGNHGSDPGRAGPTQRIGGTCATTVVGVLAGVRLFRVHDVQPNLQAAHLAAAIQQRG